VALRATTSWKNVGEKLPLASLRDARGEPAASGRRTFGSIATVPRLHRGRDRTAAATAPPLRPPRDRAATAPPLRPPRDRAATAPPLRPPRDRPATAPRPRPYRHHAGCGSGGRDTLSTRFCLRVEERRVQCVEHCAFVMATASPAWLAAGFRERTETLLFCVVASFDSARCRGRVIRRTRSRTGGGARAS
jgi:hypothetical protein